MKNNFKFKFLSDIEQAMDITKDIFEECSNINKFFVLRIMQVFDENKLVCEAQITIFNFNILQNNILDLTALYFCIDLKVILSNSRDKLFGTKTKKDNIIKRK